MKVRTVLLSLWLWLVFAGGALGFSPDLEGEIQRDLQASRSVVVEAMAGLNGGASAAYALSRLQALAENLQITHLLLQERFRGRASTLDGEALTRQEAMESRYSGAVDDYIELASSLAAKQEITAGDLAPLLSLIDRIIPRPAHPILGSLPYRHLNLPPVLPNGEPTVVPAYASGEDPAVEADTQGSDSAPISAEIAALAESLGWNPVQIYEWVQANIESEWYWGSMKGAGETLRQKSGNDADQAALLVALLRASGYPSRFVRGTIEFFPGIDTVKNLTGLDDPLKIAAFFQKAGIPFAPVIAGGRIANLQIEHVWVETLVPYSNYRGALVDDAGKVWVPLDTHLKPGGCQWNQPAELGADFPLSGLRDDYLAAPRAETPLEYLRTQVEQRSAGIPYADHLRAKTTTASALGILPSSLQFTTLAVTGEYAEIPAELRHVVTFSAAALNGTELFNFTLDASRAASRQLILSYEPETVADQRLIDSYGGLNNTPTYLVHLRPVLLLEGERLIVAGEGLPMGADFDLTVTLNGPGGSEETSARHIAGNLSAIGIACQKAVMPEELPLEEKDAPRLLSEEALAYIDRWNKSEEEIASLLKLALVRPLPTVVTVGGVIDVTVLLDTPHGFTWKGVFIDAGLRRVETVAQAGQEGREKEFMRLSALEGSILEHRLFEDDFGVASISTAKLLPLAGQTPVPLLALDQNNAEALLPGLDLAGNVQEDIRNAVHQGLVVTVPEREIVYGSWSGIGYIKEDPQTGEAGYMLSGMIAGGMTAEEWAAGYLRDVLQTPYGEPPNGDAQAAAHIAKIPVGDRQNGTVAMPVQEPLAVLVTDIKGRPVRGASVTFTRLAGGGDLDVKTFPAVTDANGIARVSPVLGTHTADNPSFRRLNTADAYTTQVGLNLFTASVASRIGDLAIDQPFQIYAAPDAPQKFIKLLGDQNRALVNNPGGTVKVMVVDRHENPVSNIPVTFTVKETVSQDPQIMPLPSGYRSIEFYLSSGCNVAYPLYGDCATAASLTRTTAYSGAGVNTILGNTVNTKYTVKASAPGIEPMDFTLYTTGFMESGDYLPPELFVQHLTTLNDRGEIVDAAKVGETLRAPLTAAMFMLVSGYTTEKYSCGTEAEPADCWRIKGTGLVDTQRMGSDTTVTFTPVVGDGATGPTQRDEDGLFRAAYTTGPQPLLNKIEAVGKATVTVPEALCDSYGKVLLGEYRSEKLPTRTVTVQTGQRLLFNDTTKELWPNTKPQKTMYEVYGVHVPTAVAPTIALLGDGGMAQSDIAIDYAIQPAGAAPTGYSATSAQVDLFITGADGKDTWVGFLVGDATAGNGTAIFSRGSVFDPQKRYSIQTVLNRGSDVEIRGDKIPVATLFADLDIDSDNNAGWNEDGTHKLPSRNPLEDQAEDLIGHPGKVIRPNLLDPDGDKIPGFADGIQRDGVNLFGITGNPNGLLDSAPFVPVLIDLGGSTFDPAKAKITFTYPGSDPAQVIKSAGADGKDTYTPASGSLRLWTKDGGIGRNVKDVADGGHYIRPDISYGFDQLAAAGGNGSWKLYLEGLTASNGTGDQRILVKIDPDGDGPLPELEADAVRATAPMVGLIPDYNHNRKIDDEDRARAARGDIYYFWINDDDDALETIGEDIPGVPMLLGKLDWEDGLVDGVRDLIDFFPISIEIKNLLEIFDPSEYLYSLTGAEDNLNLMIPDLKSQDTKKYLEDVPTARELGNRMNFRVRSARSGFNPFSTLQSSISSDPLQVQRKFLDLINRIKNGDTEILLAEGTKKSTSPLILDVRDQAGQQVFTTSLNLSLDGVEQMFRHINVIQEVGGPPPGDFPSGTRFGGLKSRYIGPGEEPANFPDAETKTGKHFVFLHGYNVNGQQARGYNTEIFKRLYWSGVTAKFWGVSWYGFESQNSIFTPNFHVNVVNAIETASVLVNKMPSVIKDGEITLAAHSLGNAVMASLISDHYVNANWPAPIKKAFMIDAAIAMETLDGGIPKNLNMFHPRWFDYSTHLWASEWYKLFDDAREKLTWRSRYSRFANLCKNNVNGKPQINCYNYYSGGEEVLATHDDPGLFWDSDPNYLEGVYPPGRYAFALQERLKGRVDSTWLEFMDAVYDKNELEERPVYIAGSPHGGWGFRTNTGILLPEEANKLTNTQLQTEPFFKVDTIFNGLLDTTVSNLENKRRDLLLSEAIPALTLPAGGPSGGDLIYSTYFSPEKLIDMQQSFKNEWPIDRGTDKAWRHSDIRKVSYLYIYNLFDSLSSE